MMRIIYFLALSFMIISCGRPDTTAETAENDTSENIQAQSQDHTGTESTPLYTEEETPEEDRTVKMVMDLPEMKAKSDEIDSTSGGKSELQGKVSTRPDKNDPFYTVQVGESSNSNFVTYFSFKVDPKSKNIKVYDVIEDKEMTLEEWRKLYKERKF